MQGEDQYLERSQDLVGKIRKMREAAEREMNRFTRVADYDVRRVVGQKQKASQVSDETASPSSANNRSKKPAAGTTKAQIAMEFSPSAAEPRDDGEDA